MSDRHHKPNTSQFFWSKLAPLIASPVSTESNFFLLSQKPWHFFPLTLHQKTLSALSSKYIQNLTTSPLVQVPIISCLDIWSSILTGLPASTLAPLQAILNTPPRVILLKYNSDLISPVFKALQCLHLTLDEHHHLCSGLQGFIQPVSAISLLTAPAPHTRLRAVPETTAQLLAHLKAFALAAPSEKYFNSHRAACLTFRFCLKYHLLFYLK